MADMQDVLSLVQELDTHELQQLRAFIDQQLASTDTRIFDLHPGAMTMAADFDDPLPDSFWLGEA